MKRYAMIGIFALVWLPGVCRAQTIRPLSLGEAQREARAHAPESAELTARLRGAELTASAAGRIFRSNPVLSGSYSPGSLVPERDEQSWNLGVSQTFDVSGSWGPRRDSARADRDRIFYEREEGLRALDEAVAMVIAEISRAQRHTERASRIVRLQTVASEAARKQLEVGQGNQLDVDAADLDLAGVRADAALAATALQAARTELARLLGRVDATSLVIEDPTESVAIDRASYDAHVEESPRVQAARSEVRAAQHDLDTQKRMIWPEITLRLSYDDVRQNVPLGAFRGPAASGLSATWGDRDISIGLELPVPLLNQRQPERAQATSRILSAEARVRGAEAEVRRDVEVAQAMLDGTARALQEVASTPQIVEREFELLDKAVRSGALDAVARAVALRRLQEAAGRYDDAVRDVRVARARWRRVSSRMSALP